jgi:hypothetical protein
VLGTPNEESWPGVKQLADYKPTFPQWSAQDLAEQVPYLDEAGIDLLKVLIFVPYFLLIGLADLVSPIANSRIRQRPAHFRKTCACAPIFR